jgi:hypothetical protein
MDVSADYSVVSAFAGVVCQVLLKPKNEVNCFLDTPFEIARQAEITKSNAMAQLIVSSVDGQDEIISTISQEAQPGRDGTNTIKHVTVCDQITKAVRAHMICLVHDADASKRDTVGYHGPQELVVVASNEYDFGALFGMSQYATHHVGVALSPAPAVLLDPPGVDDVTHQIQLIGGVVLEEIVEQICLAVSGAKVHVTYEYGSVVHRTII